MLKLKDISNDLPEVVTAVRQPQRSFRAIFKQFKSKFLSCERLFNSKIYQTVPGPFRTEGSGIFTEKPRLHNSQEIKVKR